MSAHTKLVRPAIAALALLMAGPRPAAAQDRAPIAGIAAVSAFPDTITVAAAADTVVSAMAQDTTVMPAIAAAPTAARAHSPGRALAVGVGASLAPTLIALILDPPGSGSDFAPEAALSIGAGLGIMIGPAVGLASGGRSDLAKRGVLIRTLGVASVGAGVLGFWVAFADDMGTEATTTSALMILGAAGGLVTAGSWLHDLAITPGAVARGRPLHAELGVRPDGLVAVRVRF
jgi:hypothetical protein